MTTKQASVRHRAVEETGAHPEHAALLRRYAETGDPCAREMLIELHLPLVRALARRYANRGERLEDLVQVGSIGLIQAIDRFDPARGSDLVSFAVPTITGEIKRHLRDRSAIVRVPRSVGGYAPPPLSLSVAEGESVERDAALVVEGEFEMSEERLLLAAGFRTLAERERRILHLRFFAGLSQQEIASQIGISQIQVSRLIRNSLDRMRGTLGTRRATSSESLVER
jgi:RNA polymerase sigma-B factor